MDLLFLIAAAVMIYLVLQLGGVGRNTQARRLNSIFFLLERRYRGRLTQGGLFRRPKLRFSYLDTQCDVVWHYDQNGYLEVTLGWPDAKLMLGLFSSLAIANQRQSPGFENEFLMTCSDPESLDVILTPELKQAIRVFRRSGKTTGIHMTVHRGRLTLKSFGKLASSEDMFQRVRASLAVYSAAQLAATTGIDWLGDSVFAPIPADAVCKICGESIAEDYVTCASCFTPHHFDCWIYYGACSTYGCQGNQFLTQHKEEEGQPLRNR